MKWGIQVGHPKETDQWYLMEEPPNLDEVGKWISDHTGLAMVFSSFEEAEEARLHKESINPFWHFVIAEYKGS